MSSRHQAPAAREKKIFARVRLAAGGGQKPSDVGPVRNDGAHYDIGIDAT